MKIYNLVNALYMKLIRDYATHKKMPNLGLEEILDECDTILEIVRNDFINNNYRFLGSSIDPEMFNEVFRRLKVTIQMEEMLHATGHT